MHWCVTHSAEWAEGAPWCEDVLTVAEDKRNAFRALMDAIDAGDRPIAEFAAAYIWDNYYSPV